MSEASETFFTSIGCMDGRCQEAVWVFGKKKFSAQYPDAITEVGLVGALSRNPSKEFLAQLKAKIDISINKHHSKGIVVYGHQDCAGNPVDDEVHKKDTLKAADVIRSMVSEDISVAPVFIKRENGDWISEKLQ